MGIASDIAADWHAALAALAWQLDAGVDEALSDTPVDRYGLPEAQPAPRPAAAAPAARPQTPTPEPVRTALDPVAVAAAAAAAARTLDDLREAVAAFDLCELKKGARNTVFSDGNPAARLLILGEAPGRDEDLAGRPFVGRAGQLLDRMFAAIGLSRQSPDAESALYITNVMFWRPPGNRDPEPAEIAMMKPFVLRHIELADPQVIVVMGNTPLSCLTGHRGILRARGNWTTALDRPMLPMTHPAYLLRNPAAKRDAWADLLAIRERLRG
ncbi:uracil-DNA glycosylase [Rhodobacter sp. SGA-6-6]|uniref:uracil-DNA glycosylase n=1 Tax=Rhodobacter sp. SGA-6-6 TaxID=2710882 RepID=UPI0013EAEFA2|nr:uracil-DNA glycosylase [Rhodobacter sp. SGA-6-6]NGM44982.1 uracil-DNA glycosylase [Rhodobacter sp. SGA-6-6]